MHYELGKKHRKIKPQAIEVTANKHTTEDKIWWCVVLHTSYIELCIKPHWQQNICGGKLTRGFRLESGCANRDTTRLQDFTGKGG